MREWLIHRMQHERTGNSTMAANASEMVGTLDSATEMTRLLAVDERFSGVEEIAMDTLSVSSRTLPSAANESQFVDDDDAIIELR